MERVFCIVRATTHRDDVHTSGTTFLVVLLCSKDAQADMQLQARPLSVLASSLVAPLTASCLGHSPMTDIIKFVVASSVRLERPSVLSHATKSVHEDRMSHQK